MTTPFNASFNCIPTPTTPTADNVHTPCYLWLQGSEQLARVNNIPLQVESSHQGMITRADLLYEAGGGNQEHQIQYTITTQPTDGNINYLIFIAHLFIAIKYIIYYTFYFNIASSVDIRYLLV